MTQQPHQTIDDRQLIQAGYRYALSLTHREHEAEDLIQQACLKSIRSRGCLVSKSYLFVAIRHLFYDSGRQPRNSSIDETIHESVVDGKANHTADIDRRIDIEQLLSCLRPEEREALYLNSVEGYSAAEIGDLTDRPRNTVLSLLSRAKKKLIARQTTATSLPTEQAEVR